MMQYIPFIIFWKTINKQTLQLNQTKGLVPNFMESTTRIRQSALLEAKFTV